MKKTVLVGVLAVLLALLASCAHNRYGYTDKQWAAMSEKQRAAAVKRHDRERPGRDSAAELQRARDAGLERYDLPTTSTHAGWPSDPATQTR